MPDYSISYVALTDLPTDLVVKAKSKEKPDNKYDWAYSIISKFVGMWKQRQRVKKALRSVLCRFYMRRSESELALITVKKVKVQKLVTRSKFETAGDLKKQVTKETQKYEPVIVW